MFLWSFKHKIHCSNLNIQAIRFQALEVNFLYLEVKTPHKKFKPLKKYYKKKGIPMSIYLKWTKKKCKKKYFDDISLNSKSVDLN